jgi:hypothetical protein
MAANDRENLKKVVRLQQEIYIPLKVITMLESRLQNANA